MEVSSTSSVKDSSMTMNTKKTTNGADNPPEPTLFLKVQTAGSNWERTHMELLKLRRLLLKTGYECTKWTPQKLGIKMLTPNKIRGMVLKRVLMIMYPFDSFWETETLDETLHKCLLVCQQMGLEKRRSVVWGQCSMDQSYEFWKLVLKAVPRIGEFRSQEELAHEAKSRVIATLISSRGTDWDKQIARNFEDALPKMSTNVTGQEVKRGQQGQNQGQRHKSNFRTGWQNSFKHVFGNGTTPRGGGGGDADSGANGDKLTSTVLARLLRSESQKMMDTLKMSQKNLHNGSGIATLRIERAFRLGSQVSEIGEEFENYMLINNRGAFKDVESLTNHTDQVIKQMSKLAAVYQGFHHEFLKYFGGAAGVKKDIEILRQESLLNNKIRQLDVKTSQH